MDKRVIIRNLTTQVFGIGVGMLIIPLKNASFSIYVCVFMDISESKDRRITTE